MIKEIDRRTCSYSFKSVMFIGRSALIKLIQDSYFQCEITATFFPL